MANEEQLAAIRKVWPDVARYLDPESTSDELLDTYRSADDKTLAWHCYRQLRDLNAPRQPAHRKAAVAAALERLGADTLDDPAVRKWIANSTRMQPDSSSSPPLRLPDDWT